MLKIFLIFLSSVILLVLGYLSLSQNYFFAPVSVNSEREAINLVRQRFSETQEVPDQSAVLGKASGVLSEPANDGWKVLFYLGNGDCPSGCTDEHEWYFTVGRRGQVTKQGEFSKKFNGSENKFVTQGARLEDFIKVTSPTLKDSGVGIIEATFILSPAKPVCGVGESDCSAPMKGLPVDIFRQDNKISYYSGKTDASGKFMVPLLPGDYYFVYETLPTEGKTRKNFTVKAGETVKLQITVDTGIR